MKRLLVWLIIGLLLVALGIVVGSGPLQLGDRRAQQRLEDLQARVDDLAAAHEQAAETIGFADAFAARVEGAVIGGVLARRGVALVVFPGADASDVAALAEAVRTAGGSLTGTIALGEQAVTAGGRPLVEELTARMMVENPNVAVPDDAGGYERLGALLGRAIGTPDAAASAERIDDTAVAILAALEAAEVITVADPIQEQADVVLAVAGPVVAQGDTGAPNAVPVLLLDSLADRVATVVAGSTDAAAPAGLVGAIRADPTASGRVSTVDSIEFTMGRLAAIRVSAAALDGRGGHFGADAPDGPLPGR